MRSSVMKGTIERRLLVNFAVEPEVLRRLLPKPFRPKLVRGYGVAGICLIRLNHIRPALLPMEVGVASENAAHRIAVVWDDESGEREGVFIPRRDTSSRLNVLAGGRFFPGIHRRAAFSIDETDPYYRVAFRSDDGTTGVVVSGRRGRVLSPGSIFSSLEEASRFFRAGSVGYSSRHDSKRFDGLSLETQSWEVEPFDVHDVCSSFFDDTSIFPASTVHFDNALIMRSIEHCWEALPPLAA
jgi:hypothetical protein